TAARRAAGPAGSLLATDDPEAAREWLFVVGRPTLVVADGPFAAVAWEDGLEVITLTGPDRPALAPAAARGERCIVVPMRTDRPPAAYGPLVERFSARGAEDVRQGETPGPTLPPG
ncbi:MAG: phosphatase, partial [Actinomycetota bacterium]